MERLKYNRLILKELEQLVEEQPSIRFWQLLYNLNIINGFPNSDGSLTILDEYNRESKDIYERLIQAKNEQEQE